MGSREFVLFLLFVVNRKDLELKVWIELKNLKKYNRKGMNNFLDSILEVLSSWTEFWKFLYRNSETVFSETLINLYWCIVLTHSDSFSVKFKIYSSRERQDVPGRQRRDQVVIKRAASTWSNSIKRGIESSSIDKRFVTHRWGVP